MAGLFDDVFGFVLGTLDQPAFTGELSIRYERPTPLDRPLLCRGWLDRREGRKLWIVGELVDVVRGRPAGAGQGDEPVHHRADHGPRRRDPAAPGTRRLIQRFAEVGHRAAAGRNEIGGVMANTSFHVPAAAHTSS